VFTFIPESCSDSPRNTVRIHPGIAFTLDRNPHLGEGGSRAWENDTRIDEVRRRIRQGVACSKGQRSETGQAVEDPEDVKLTRYL
jgi:hypothetical protein